jgi:hypothetical protein
MALHAVLGGAELFMVVTLGVLSFVLIITIKYCLAAVTSSIQQPPGSTRAVLALQQYMLLLSSLQG